METPSTETPATETPGTETPAAETPAGETPATETPGMETSDGETPATEAPEPENTGIVPPHLQGESDPRVTMPAETAGLVDDFDGMLEAEAASLGEAATSAANDAVGEVTAPVAAAEAAVDDVLGEMQVAAAAIDVPTPEMATVGALADPIADVIGDQPPPLVDDFSFEMPDEPEITFEAPEPEPAMADFEPDTDLDDLAAAAPDAADDFMNP